jgi:hypothetical protein
MCHIFLEEKASLSPSPAYLISFSQKKRDKHTHTHTQYLKQKVIFFLCRQTEWAQRSQLQIVFLFLFLIIFKEEILIVNC